MAKSRSRSNLSRYRPYMAAAMSLGRRLAGRMSRKSGTSYSRTNRRSYKSGSGVTSQYDKATQYRRKVAPKRIKRKCRKLAKNYEWNLIRSLGTNTWLRNSSLFGSWVAGATTQFAVNACLFGLRGSGDSPVQAGFQDLQQILGQDTSMDNAFEKAIFSSGVMDITYTNTSTVQFTQEVDVYEIIFVGRTSGGTCLIDYNAQFTATPTIGLGTAIGDFSPRGVTPFECPGASSMGYRVIKKTKYFISAGNCFTYQIRDSKNKWLEGSEFWVTSQSGESQWRAKTRNVLFISKPISGTPAGNAGSFSIGVTRKYMYKVLQKNNNQTATI